MNVCLVCDNKHDTKSTEHIVSESFGNNDYVMQKGEVCDECNGRFSKFEAKALSNSIFAMERARLGVKTKKGKSVKGKIDGLEVTGNPDFKKSHVEIDGLNEDNLEGFDPISRTGKLTVKSFDRSEVATSKLLLKIGFESLYTSRRTIFNKFSFQDLKSYLTNDSNQDWGFITARTEQGKFKSIPRFLDKYGLKRRSIELRFLERSDGELLFKFRFSGVSMIINLLNRGLDWVDDYKENEEHSYIYPDYLEERYNKQSQ